MLQMQLRPAEASGRLRLCLQSTLGVLQSMCQQIRFEVSILWIATHSSKTCNTLTGSGPEGHSPVNRSSPEVKEQ